MRDPLLRASAVAELLDVSVSTVERLARAKKLRAVRVEGQWRFLADDVDAYIAAQTSGPALQVVKPAQPTRKAMTAKPATTGEYYPVVKGPVPWRSQVIE
jgi:excisionase family DNA binding protein